MTTLTKFCNGCKQDKPVEDFYKRKNSDSYSSECKDCMKARSKARNPSTEDVYLPRVQSEIDAIAYLRGKGIAVAPGKAFRVPWVPPFTDLVAWGCVYIEVKYSALYTYHERSYFKFLASPKQIESGYTAHVVLLMCGYTRRTTYHLFSPNDPVFYIQKDGEPEPRLKRMLSYYPGTTEQSRTKTDRVVMTDAMMDAAQDNIALIWETMAAISRELMGA